MAKLEHFQQLSEVVEKLTTSGQKILDKSEMVVLKKICRDSDEYVKHVYRLVISQLEKDHAEIRLSAFQIIDELFMRSHCFRELLLADLQRYMELTMEIDVKQPLPLPNLAATELKHKSLEAIHRWNAKFSDVYKLLALGYNFLKSHRKINFENASTSNAFTPAEQSRAVERSMKRARQNETRIERTLAEIADLTDDIKMCLLESQNCLTLLLPHPDDFYINDQSSQTSRKESKQLSKGTKSSKGTNSGVKICESRLSSESTGNLLNRSEKTTNGGDLIEAIPSCSRDVISDDDESSEEDGAEIEGADSESVILSIDVSSMKNISVRETRNNSDVIRTLKDQVNLITNKFTPAVKNWLEVFTKTNAPHVHVRAALDLKSALESVMNKIKMINIIPKQPEQEDSLSVTRDDSDSDSDEFVEVPSKEWLSPCIMKRLKADELRSSFTLFRSPPPSATETTHELCETDAPHLSLDNNINVAGTRIKSNASLSAGDKKHGGEAACSSSQGSDVSGCSNSRQKLLKDAPIVPFGNDLYFWGDDSVAPLVQRNDTEAHRWWASQASDDVVDVHAVADIKQRVINFTGTFEPVKWKCRAPLPTGKLCERMDRVKCPFHGKIIARDMQGQPSNPDKFEEKSCMQALETDTKTTAAWEDPVMHAEIFAATGVDLSRKALSRKGKARVKKIKTGLTNIKALNRDTARKRLESKVLNSSTLKRVAQSMDEIDFKRANDKFSHNYNYTYTV